MFEIHMVVLHGAWQHALGTAYSPSVAKTEQQDYLDMTVASLSMQEVFLTLARAFYVLHSTPLSLVYLWAAMTVAFDASMR
jgi:hypothetical protein